MSYNLLLKTQNYAMFQCIIQCLWDIYLYGRVEGGSHFGSVLKLTETHFKYNTNKRSYITSKIGLGTSFQAVKFVVDVIKQRASEKWCVNSFGCLFLKPKTKLRLHRTVTGT